jgi:hypothetical protein
MDFDEQSEETPEIGSDELLSDDNLRLPDSASPLVRLHAIRSWLARRQEETTLELGEAALALQQAQQEDPQETRMRRRERQAQGGYAALQRIQQNVTDAQERLHAYEKAQALLEECLNHTTAGERALVEYYLTLEDILHTPPQTNTEAWLRAIADVQNRVERVSIPNEE